MSKRVNRKKLTIDHQDQNQARYWQEDGTSSQWHIVIQEEQTNILVDQMKLYLGDSLERGQFDVHRGKEIAVEHTKERSLKPTKWQVITSNIGTRHARAFFTHINEAAKTPADKRTTSSALHWQV